MREGSEVRVMLGARVFPSAPGTFDNFRMAERLFLLARPVFLCLISPNLCFNDAAT